MLNIRPVVYGAIPTGGWKAVWISGIGMYDNYLCCTCIAPSTVKFSHGILFGTYACPIPQYFCFKELTKNTKLCCIYEAYDLYGRRYTASPQQHVQAFNSLDLVENGDWNSDIEFLISERTHPFQISCGLARPLQCQVENVGNVTWKVLRTE